MTSKLTQDLMAVNTEIKALSKKVTKMIAAAKKLEAARPAKSPKAPKNQEKPAAKPGKKADSLTAADTVYGFVKRSRKGISTEMLEKKTGFNQKKIANIIYKLKKQEKIQSPAKGVYTKA